MSGMIVFDGNSILNRAFYGIRPLNTKDGFPTNALFGFINILHKNLQSGYEYAVIAYDLRAKTFRHKACDTYKATRKGMPEELAKQLPVSKQLSEYFGIKVVEKEGYEADDILGTISQICANNKIECTLVTGDRDSYQLVRDGVTVFLAANNETKIITPDTIKELYSLDPRQLIDLKAIMGDSSDNIKGVAGIGEKGALSLIQTYGSLDEVYAHIDEIKSTTRQKLVDCKDDAYMSRFLAEICKTVPISNDILEYSLLPRKDNDLINLFTQLEFTSLTERLSLKKDVASQQVYQKNVITPKELAALKSELFIDVTADSIDIFSEGKLYQAPINAETAKIFESDKQMNFWSIKDSARIIMDKGYKFSCKAEDISLLAYIVSPTDNGLTPEKAAALYLDVPDVTCFTAILKPLKEVLLKKLSETDGEFIYREIELPLAYLLAKTEHIGFFADKSGLTEFSQMLATKIFDDEKAIYALAGEEFNVNSPKQLGNILFEVIMLPHGKKNKSGYSTDADVLEKLSPYHPIIDLILEHRKLSKLKSTYADGLLKSISADGRIHTTFRQTLTKTGRLSSVEPNLQNIPVRTDLGREMRKFFIAEDGNLLVDADYSQIELRILAHISGDETMIDAFKNNVDIHTLTASQIFHVPLNEVTREQRKRAKAINFGIVYGIGGYSLGNDIGVSKKAADEYIKKYLATYPKIAAYLENVKAQAKIDGYVTTMYGRRRYIPELQSSKKQLVSFGERVAMNTPIQGAAADIIKKAMVDTSKALEAEGMKASIILQIHDELIIECPSYEAEKAKTLLVHCMENAFQLKAPLIADAHIGKNWFDAKNEQ